MQELVFDDLLDENCDEIVSHLDAASRGMFALVAKRYYRRYRRPGDLCGLRWVHTAMACGVPRLVYAVPLARGQCDVVFMTQMRYIIKRGLPLGDLLDFAERHAAFALLFENELFLRRFTEAVAKSPLEVVDEHYRRVSRLLRVVWTLTMCMRFLKGLCETRAFFFTARLLADKALCAFLAQRRKINVHETMRAHGHKTFLQDPRGTARLAQFLALLPPPPPNEESLYIHHFSRPLVMRGHFVPYYLFYRSADDVRIEHQITCAIQQCSLKFFTTLIGRHALDPGVLYACVMRGFCERMFLGVSPDKRRALAAIVAAAVQTDPGTWTACLPAIAAMEIDGVKTISAEYAGLVRMALAADVSLWNDTQRLPITLGAWHVFIAEMLQALDLTMCFLERVLVDFSFATFVREKTSGSAMPWTCLWTMPFPGIQHESAPAFPLVLLMSELVWSPTFSVDYIMDRLCYAVSDAFVPELRRRYSSHVARIAKTPPDYCIGVALHPPDVLQARCVRLAERVGVL